MSLPTREGERGLAHVDANAICVQEHLEISPLSPWTKSRRLKYLSLWPQKDMVEAVLLAMETMCAAPDGET